MDTITAVLKRPKIYNGKKLWEAYHSWGRAATHEKLRQWAIENGMRNPNKRVASRMGAYFSMWKYALHNPEEAYPAYEKWAKEYEEELTARGIEINFRNFLMDIREHTRRGGVIGKETYEKFCEKWELPK